MSGLLTTFVDNISRIGVADLVDIGLVAVIIYYIFRALQGTRAAQLVRGVVLLVILFAISSPFSTFHSLLRTVMEPAVIALVILFQPELRGALQRLGGFHPGAPHAQESTIDAIVEACDKLSAQRHGALIAIQRRTGLGDIAANGIRLDADVSASLLESIFYPNNPLHDGGVVIHADKIVAAACYFPVSTNPYIDRALGLRHRAGLGLSEETDAVVIIVSEQSGAVSLACDGVLETRLARGSLKSRLLKLVQTERGPLIQFPRLALRRAQPRRQEETGQ